MVVVRLLVIVVGLAAACVAAATVVTLAVLFPDWSDLAVGAWEQGSLDLIIAFAAIFVSGFALVPALAAILIAEMLGVRSLLAYAAVGGLIGIAAYAGLRNWGSGVLALEAWSRREFEVTAAAGIVGGVVYWAIAGRLAGSWRGAAPARK